MNSPGRSPGVRNLGGEELLTNLEPFDQAAIAIEILPLDVVEQPAPPSYEAKQTTTTVMILAVVFEVLGKLFDSAGEQRDLDFRRTGVLLVQTVAFDDIRLALLAV